MGMWEPEQPIYKHECKCHADGHSIYHEYRCYQRIEDAGLTLVFCVPQCCHDDEYEVQVFCCPFCGYKP